MFLPNKNAAAKEKERRAAFERVEGWALDLVPQEVREDVQISVQEVQCGDPNCSPIDTTIAVIFNSGGRGMMGLPMEAHEVTEEDLKHHFPPPEVLGKWHRGEEAEWPPMDDNDDGDALPQLRFEVGQRVFCRVGPDPTTGWAPGTVVQLWYREPNWPNGSWAPYKIKLDDGRFIFAPGDMDQVIRKNNKNPSDA